MLAVGLSSSWTWCRVSSLWESRGLLCFPPGIQRRDGPQGSSFPYSRGEPGRKVGNVAWCVLWAHPVTGVLVGFQVLILAVKQLFPEFEFMWLVDEAKKNLPLELDFLNEGRNAEKVSQMLKHFDFLKVGGTRQWGAWRSGGRVWWYVGPCLEYPFQDIIGTSSF